MYIPLYIKTDYSLLSSLITIDELINKCLSLNITACAICDNNLFGVMEFYTKCKKNGIKPIIGLDLIINDMHLLLYAKNNNGYHNLVKIESLKNQDELDINSLLKYKSDLICIVLDNGFFDKKIEFEDIYVGVNDNLSLGHQSNLVFINETLYLNKSDSKYLPYLLMIRDGKTIEEGVNVVSNKNYLLTNEVIKLVDNETLNNTYLIADMCNVSFDNNIVYMPKYEISNNISSKDYLTKLCYAGLNKRLNMSLNQVYLDRLQYELDVIFKMNFEDYILVVYDFIKFAKRKDILVGPGRGSAAGSLVTYSLGITDVDPIKYNLLFERFLNPERISMPDIDTDFPDVDRDQVIKYVVNKYGKANVANIVTFGTLGAKQALRDVGRVLNIELKSVDYLCKKLGFNDTLKTLKDNSETYNFIRNDQVSSLMYDIALKLENNKRHTSTHAAGIVISCKPLDEILPIMVSDNISQTEFTMEYLEQLGLIKMDFLGIRHLTMIKSIIDDINKNEGLNLIFNEIPLDDSLTFKLFQNGDTSGIFQFESVGMKNFLRELKPECLEDIFAAIALFRPGPANNIPSYIKRKNGKEAIDYFDSSLETILKPTYGIIIYQEQIIQIASVMAGYSLGEADILRRAMSKKKLDLLEQEKERFVNNSINRGYNDELSNKVFSLILKFAGYGFNRSHSVSYSMVAYKMAYLKTHYARYFYANLLTGNIGSESKTREYIVEAKKMGSSIKLPDVNVSNSKYQIVGKSIVLPLSAVRNIGQVIANYIIKEQTNGKFNNIFDFLIRTYEKTSNKKVYESLVLSSSLDSFGYTKKALIDNYDIIFNYVDLCIQLGQNAVEMPEVENTMEYDKDYLLEKEKELFGFYITSHKTEKFKLNNKNIVDVNILDKYFSKKVDLIIHVDRIKEITTKNNEQMAFITGSDATGEISITLFPKIYQNLSLKKNNVLKVKGTVEKRYNEYQVVAISIETLN